MGQNPGEEYHIPYIPRNGEKLPIPMPYIQTSELRVQDHTVIALRRLRHAQVGVTHNVAELPPDNLKILQNKIGRESREKP